MLDSHLNRLDGIAKEVVNGCLDNLGVLSKGEYLYVVLAANRADLLGDDSIAYSLLRIGPEWTQALMDRWQYASYPVTRLASPVIE